MEDEITVEGGARGVRLDAFMAEQVPDVSRSQWKLLILQSAVTLNGAPAKPNQKVCSGDRVAWTLPEESSEEPLPENIPLEILYEDEFLLALNKPPGLVVHPAAGNESGTLVNALLFYDPVFSSVERAGIVHRLDKETSGVMVVAKTEKVMVELQRQFKARETEKEYLALVWGAPPLKGRIETQMGRHPTQRQKMAVLNEGGRHAISNYTLLEQFATTALMRVKIETGRTHQIRVHMTHLGHPILGDSVYGRARKPRLPILPARQMLHAERLALNHPDSGKRLFFEAPLFDDMNLLLEALRNE